MVVGISRWNGCRLSVLTILLAAIAHCAEIPVTGRGPFLTAGRSLAWGVSGRGGTDNDYILTTLSPDHGVCLFVRNNNPTNSHAFTFSVNFTSDPQATVFGSGAGWRSLDSTQGFSAAPSVGSNGIAMGYIGPAGAARIRLGISGSIVQAGTPDTADIFLVQTITGACERFYNYGAPNALTTGTFGNFVNPVPVVMGGIVYGQNGGVKSLAIDQTGCATPICQPSSVLNQQVTSGVNAAVSITLAAAGIPRHHLYGLYARCSAGTSNITVTANAITVYTSAATAVGTANFEKDFPVPLSTFDSNQVLVVTLAACGAGNTGTLGIRASTL